MTEKYCITYIVEGTVEASNVKEGRRIVEDALLKAFDAEATNISNPEITRVKNQLY